jgi:pyridoxal phosphate enzyme (YggS family)
LPGITSKPPRPDPDGDVSVLLEGIAERWADVRERVDLACRDAGRDPAGVVILPVSKTFDAAAVRAATALGLRRFGENRLQEVRQKAGPLADCDIQWVVIGHLQTNKARDAARLASEVQSLDRLDLARALDRHLQQEGRAIDVLVQVKTSPEAEKFGLPPEQLAGFLEELRNFPTLRVGGLMTMAIHSDDPHAVRACFRQLRQLRDEMQQSGHVLSRLSMGMSGDFPLAIAEGSTEVRIGTAIFGHRAIVDVP